MQTETGFLDRLFHLSANGTTARTEMLAGITTFMTMAYILAVNPAILSVTGMDNGPGFLSGYGLYGRFCQLSLRSGSRHGPQRLLRLYSRPADGLLLANGTGSGLY
mgnify:CR=1 FL=1